MGAEGEEAAKCKKGVKKREGIATTTPILTSFVRSPSPSHPHSLSVGGARGEEHSLAFPTSLFPRQ